MKSKLIALLLTLTAAPSLFAQCRGGQCRYPAQYYYPGQYPGSYVIYQQPEAPKEAPREPDVDIPKEPEAATQKPTPKALAEQNFGVDKDKLSGQDAYTVHTPRGSCEVSKQEAHKIVGDALKDDSNKLRVTVIGDDGTQKKVLADIHSLVKDINDWAIVRGYPPGHWALQPGFVQSGNPTVYCQAPGGKVLHRQDDYAGGGEELAEALRKAKSSYDARKDPDLRKPQVPFSDNSRLVTYGLAALGGAGITHLAKRRKP